MYQILGLVDPVCCLTLFKVNLRCLQIIKCTGHDECLFDNFPIQGQSSAVPHLGHLIRWVNLYYLQIKIRLVTICAPLILITTFKVNPRQFYFWSHLIQAHHTTVSRFQSHLSQDQSSLFSTLYIPMNIFQGS